MNIVVLDGHTLNPGDLSWAELEKLGKCKIYDRSQADEVLKRSRNADIIITNKAIFSADIIAKLPRLKYIGVTATGYNVVDVEAATRHNIVVTNVPAYSTLSVAQMTFAHILNLCHHVTEHSSTVKNGNWSASADFCYWNFSLVELQDLTLGIVGFGRIGLTVAKIAETFGMRVIYYDTSEIETVSDKWQKVSLDEIFIQSDIITLHCPLTPDTENLVDKDRLDMMKSSAFLINTSRGQLVNEKDLSIALNSGRISGAGLDVLSSEPPKKDNPLLSAKNCYITPHIAWATKAARQRLMNTVVHNVHAFLDGKTTNKVN